MSERIVPARYKFAVPVKVWFEPDERAAKLKIPATAENLFLWGETHDLRRSGIAFLLPSIRIKENYLVGSGRFLLAELDLPNGKTQMQIMGKRYEQVGEHLSVSRYLIGASIEHISPEILETYEYFLYHGKHEKAGGSLALGVDKG